MARILIVDDTADMRQLLSSILVEEGHQVVVAADGVKALEMMQLHPPDLVVLDVMMPTKDGYTVLRDMKAMGLREMVKVLLLTAKNSEHDWLRGYKLGADHYLTKPFELDELVEAVEFVLATSKDALRERREQELGKAQLLARLESLFEGP